MFIFLYGADTYRLRWKLNEIVAHYKNLGSVQNLDSSHSLGIKKIRQSGLNLRYCDGQNLNFQDFLDEIQQTSIFKEKKLIVLSNVFLNTEFKKSFLVGTKRTPLLEFVKSSDIILFSQEKEVSEKDALFIFLKKYAKCQEFKLLDSQKLKKWIEIEFSTYKSRISQQAIQKLIDFIGNNLWQLSNEIKKLVSYKKGGKVDEDKSSSSPFASARVVEVKDVELLVSPKIESDIFKTIEAIANKNKKQALSLLHKHLEKGDNSLYLFSMINFQFRNLLIIKDLIERGCPFYVLAKEARLHPYVVRKTYSQAQKFTFQELKKIYQKIFQIDLKIKTGQIDVQLALDLLIADI